MWPKAFAQLVELAPHISRLLPMADRFFQSRNATDESTQKAMDAMAEGLRGDLGQVTAAHAGLYRGITELDLKLDKIAADAHASRLSQAFLEQRIAKMEVRESRILLLLVVAVVLLSAVCVLAALLFARAH